MTIARALAIEGGKIVMLDRRDGLSMEQYLLEWQVRNGIPDGTPVVICPLSQAQKVEDFLEALRALSHGTNPTA